MSKNENITYKKNNPITAGELISVFSSVGWNKQSKNIVPAFQNSYYVTAYNDNDLIGFARAISDGYYYTNIFDVIVKPAYQKRGIGKEMMRMLREKFKGTYLFLTYTKGNMEFYKKCGFENNDKSMWIHIYRS
ncbi:MAG: GNAT family N-acetyltransferase [Candidatus Cloacimonetes bacterium]|nr:GNAT family N-acetyltransferase [Candidatus Cloacimonadota bacterium]MBS3767223.1 GNAT family N-acetyltransferase [Candidatus Cloacimonadota bacterium]